MGQRRDGQLTGQPQDRGGVVMILLDPTDERTPIARTLAPRRARPGPTVGLIDISKPRGDVLLDQLARRLAERQPGIIIKRFRKPTFTKPSPDELRGAIKDVCDAVVFGL